MLTFQKTAEVHCHNTRYANNQNYFIQVSTNAGKKNNFSSSSYSLGKCRSSIQR